MKIPKPDFKNEKELDDYIHDQIDSLFEAVTKLTFKKSERQKVLSRYNTDMRSLSLGRVDHYVESKCGQKYIIEVKCPKKFYDTSHGITQLLGYKEIFEEMYGLTPNLILIGTHPDALALRIINKNKLPITYVYLTKEGAYTAS